MDPGPFLRGVAFAGYGDAPYLRARPEDAVRLPADTWASAQVPVGLRLEFVGDAEAVAISYETRTDDLGYRGDGAGRTFVAWRKGALIAEEPAVLGPGRVRLTLGGPAEERVVVYLPEGMKPVVVGIEGVGGSIEPAPAQPRWIVYGDSVAEGWLASGPSVAWPSIAGRDHALDVVNLGYAGAARGEIVSAEHVAALASDVITICHGTNCWTRIPHSAGMMRETVAAFLEVVRRGHPQTPIVVVSPVLRPDAERSPNALRATLADLRVAMEEAVESRIAAGDERLDLVGGLDLIDDTMLADGIHPNDKGHAALAASLGPIVRRLV